MRDLRRSAPGPTRSELLRRLPRLHADPLGELSALFQQYGDIVRLSLFRDYFILVHPQALRHVFKDRRKNFDKGRSFDELRLLIGNGLLTASEDAWVTQRRRLAAAFTTRAAQADVALVARAADSLAEIWTAKLHGVAECPRLVSQDFAQLTLRIASSALVGIDASARSHELDAALLQASTAVIKRMTALVRLPLWLPMPANRRLRRAVANLDEMLADVLLQSRASASSEPPGFLQRLFAMHAQEFADRAALASVQRQIRDEAMTFFLASYDTTSNSLAFTAHLLSQHPDVQADLRQELENVLGSAPIDLAALGRLTYLDAVIAESLRLFPAVPIILRDVQKDDVISGCVIPQGSVVVCMPYLTHRHPHFFAQPQEFFPQRFLDGNLSDEAATAYLPFGIQPRACIGEPMARLWIKTVLAVLLRKFTLRADPNFVLKPQALVTLMPRDGVKLHIARLER